MSLKEIDFEYLKDITRKIINSPVTEEELKEIDKFVEEICLEELKKT